MPIWITGILRTWLHVLLLWGVYVIGKAVFYAAQKRFEQATRQMDLFMPKEKPAAHVQNKMI